MSFINILINENQIYKNNFKQNKLFEIVKEGKLNDDSQKEKFLDYFQIWSNAFQKIIMARIVFSENNEFEKLAWHHLQEELGHNLQLLKNRQNYVALEDSILEALASWFIFKMLTLGDSARTVLIHLVIESCASIFYENLGPLFLTSNISKEHFSTHLALDPEHEKIGIDLLKKIQSSDITLLNIQKKGWQMIEALFNRLAELCYEETNEVNLHHSLRVIR